MSNNGFVKNKEYSESTSVFYGIDKGERIGAGWLADSLNMTSGKFPCLATRSERMSNMSSVVPGVPVDAIYFEDNVVVACSNGTVLIDKYEIEGIREIRRLVNFGGRIFAFPHGKVFYRDGDEWKVKSIPCVAWGSYEISYCDSFGASIDIATGEKPASPENGAYWADAENKALYKYSSASEAWVSIASMYIKLISDEPAFGCFNAGDAITLEGAECEYNCFVHEVVENQIVLECSFADISSGPTALVREAPTLDYCCEHDNRIWGCHYDGKINEIYASKLGDGFNWNSFRGLSTDSYAVSVGDANPFTGCVELGEAVIFFKENCIYTIYGTEPSSFQTVRTECFGVQKGSERSIARINGRVFYKSCHGVMMLSEGSLPVCISDSLGRDIWHDAVGGTDGRRYYISMTDIDGKTEMFVYDIEKGIWHKESISCDGLFSFLTINNNLLALGGIITDEAAFPVVGGIDAQALDGIEKPKKEDFESNFAYQIVYAAYLYTKTYPQKLNLLTKEELRANIAENQDMPIEQVTDEFIADAFSSYYNTKKSYKHIPVFEYLSKEKTCNEQLPVCAQGGFSEEGRFLWECETGIRGLESVNFKRLKSIDIQLKLGAGARCDVSVQYDGRGGWEKVGSAAEEGISTLRIKDSLDRCETYRLRLSGYGEAVIYSITEAYEDGGSIGF